MQYCRASLFDSSDIVCPYFTFWVFLLWVRAVDLPAVLLEPEQARVPFDFLELQQRVVLLLMLVADFFVLAILFSPFVDFFTQV